MGTGGDGSHVCIFEASAWQERSALLADAAHLHSLLPAMLCAQHSCICGKPGQKVGGNVSSLRVAESTGREGNFGKRASEPPRV